MLITQKEVETVAKLARLRLTETEKSEYTEQLNAILEYVKALEQVDTSQVEPMAHVLPLQNVWREDQVKTGLTQEAALANAPVQEDGYFKVPKIV